MIDLAHEYTDELIDEERKRLEREFRRAAKELDQKIRGLLTDFAVDDNAKRKLVEEGKMTFSEYTQWRTTRLMVGHRQVAMRDAVINELEKVSKRSINRLRESMIDVYAFSHNFGTWEMETTSLTNTLYTLYNHDAVVDLIMNNPDTLRLPALKSGALRQWNAQLLNSSIMQSIMQGESIPKLAARVSRIAHNDKVSSYRTARTMLGVAENKGKHDSYKRAQSKGLDVYKTWIPIVDGRTRDSHKFVPPHGVNGQTVPLDKPYLNGLMYPNDMETVYKPEEVYNCRCRETAEAKRTKACKYDLSDKLDNMSYEEWEKKHHGSNKKH